MSSHHFVREGQEPALLIADPVDFALAEPLLEWAPLVVVTESALESVLMWGIKIDVVIAQPDHVGMLTEKLQEQAPIQILSAGDDSLEASMLFLSGLGNPGVSIVCDKFSAVIKEKLEVYGSRIQITLREQDKKWSFIPSGVYRKWFYQGAMLYFFDPSVIADTVGLRPRKGGYEIVQDQWVSINSNLPFWIGESL
jgi:hypothetical protein